jgi:cysteine synthase
MKVCNEEAQMGVDTRLATEGTGGTLDSMSRSLRERNAVDMVLCAAAVEAS